MAEPDIQLSLSAWQAALDRFASKQSTPSAMRSAEWAQMPIAARERAFFSAGVASAHMLQDIRKPLEMAMQGFNPDRLTKDGAPVSYSRADAIADIRAKFGAVGDSGKLTDITSYKRLELINEFQTEQAYSYGRWKRDLEDSDILDEFPAHEFVRVSPRERPRTDWWERWARAGNSVGWVGASRASMAALKTSPIWRAFSRFGTPFPPFDFGSGMGLRDMDRDEAIAIGLIPEDWEPGNSGAQALEDFNNNVEASVKELEGPGRMLLREILGDKVRIDGDRAILINHRNNEGLPGPTSLPDADRQNAQQRFRRSERALESMGRRVLRTEEDRRIEAEIRYSAAAQIASVSDGFKPLYHEQLTEPLARAMAAQLQQSLPAVTRTAAIGSHIYVWRPDVLRLPIEKIHSEITSGRGGRLLGYGSDLFEGRYSIVQILDPSNNVVAGFHAPLGKERLYAFARTADFSRATGEKHSYRIVK